MTKRGRKSAASLAVAATTADQRLAPSACLTDAERIVWVDTVNDLPAGAIKPRDRFLLENYCRNLVRASILSEELLAFNREWLADDDGLERYHKLQKMIDIETRSASSLATRLRLTPQAVYDPKTVGRERSNSSGGTKPWQLTRDGEH